jgi:hypothetical protein
MNYLQAKTVLKTTKSLLLCPVCEGQGRKEILGELDEDGNFVVIRYKGNAQNGSTKIVSKAFEVKCGVCNEIVFYRKD